MLLHCKCIALVLKNIGLGIGCRNILNPTRNEETTDACFLKYYAHAIVLVETNKNSILKFWMRLD